MTRTGTRTDRLLTFAFPDGISIAPRRAGKIGALLRQAVMSRMPDPLPPEVSGHDADHLQHVAYLPLLDAGRPAATGQITGVGVSVPAGSPDLATLLRDVLRARNFHLRLSRTSLPLQEPARNDPVLEPSRWTASSLRWSTVTPIVFDRFPGRGGENAELARACVHMGLPEPSRIATARDPFLPGAADLARRDLARQEPRPRPYTHATIEFPIAVTGPLLLGAQRYLGMGLLKPTSA
ncbi:type I-U CRISPR-associated protein Csb2 [Saccharopolyspora sp. 7B]|uniref:type I-G CRISPR-associated protein Csb2 n=1 Tax=Saccharopolyspora sp. 7B TaxID=2877240 RepID=UPI001CD3D77A|nr:type I-U CRISPR-associated protein Csb2 [Saccharopolyspora sp. 7B]MCA1278263.1 type I-U CRISPR-associated protein Cas5/Cas6 [Saccharopolyspora sp. 7B]